MKRPAHLNNHPNIRSDSRGPAGSWTGRGYPLTPRGQVALAIGLLLIAAGFAGLIMGVL